MYTGIIFTPKTSKRVYEVKSGHQESSAKPKDALYRGLNQEFIKTPIIGEKFDPSAEPDIDYTALEEYFKNHAVGEGPTDDLDSISSDQDLTTSQCLAENPLVLADSLRNKDRIGPFSLIQMIGMGGVGVIYEASFSDEEGTEYACHPGVPDRFAIKLIKYKKKDEETERRKQKLLRGSSYMKDFHHPGIVRVYETGEIEDKDGPIIFIMRELVKGDSIDQLLRNQGNFSQEKTIATLEQLAQGLGLLYCSGLVHRDIKPSNVLIEEATGQAKFTDFDLLEQENSPPTETITGTPAYLPLEVLEAEPHDHRSDIYALGLTAYVMLSGFNPLMVYDRLLYIYHHLKAEGIPRVNRLKADKGLRDLIAGMTDNDRASRPSAINVLQDLKKLKD